MQNGLQKDTRVSVGVSAKAQVRDGYWAARTALEAVQGGVEKFGTLWKGGSCCGGLAVAD